MRIVLAEHAFEPGALKSMPEEKRRRLLEIVEQVRSLPTLDSRSSDDLVGFDENGLPYR
jgi:hypothetical protein